MKRILIPVLFSLNLYAQSEQIFSAYRSFEGGLNNDDASIAIADNESPDLMNVMIDEPKGALTQRNGYITCGSLPSGNTATNLYEFSRNDGSRNLIVTDNITIWQTADCINYSTITTGLLESSLPRFATIRDKLWIVNGSTFPIVWDGSTASSLNGTLNKPNVPKAKYIAYWKSRVWLANENISPSSVWFTSLVDEQGTDADPATSTSAWKSVNQLYINRDDGSPIYGIKVYKDALFVFKENGISRILFESEYNISLVKNVSTIGSKFQESIVEMDDSLLRFAGKNGIYAFDGASVKRLSSKWFPTYQKIKQASKSENYKLWDTTNNFLKGSYINSDFDFNNNIKIKKYNSLTSGVTYYVMIDTPTNNIGWDNGNLGSWTNYGASINITQNPRYIKPFYGYYLQITQPVQSSTSTNWTIEMVSEGGGRWQPFTCGNVNVLDINQSSYNTLVNLVDTIKIKIYSDNGNYSVISSSGIFPILSSYLIRTASQRITGFGGKISYVCDIDISRIKPNSTYTSEISTSTGLTIWKTFDANQTLNGQTIDYSIRTATSIFNLSQKQFTPITPGSIISTTTDTYSQWRATFTTYDYVNSPEINNISLSWITGDNTKSPMMAIPYQSRYWITASTTIGYDYNDMIMVESKSPLATYTKFDLPISAFTLWNNNLYGAVSGTSKIARLDYGNNDDGKAIISYWDSRDEVFQSPLLYKSINRIITDFSRIPLNDSLSIGLSNDFGNNFSYKTLNTNINPNLVRNTNIMNLDANNSLQFRVRIKNEKYDTGFKLYGLHMLGNKTNFIGNK